MDDRQTQIRSGAGLEESRLNEEFIDFLKKWSTPVLWLIVVIGAAWWGLRYLKEQRIAKRDSAFAALNDAVSGGNPSPSSLRTIAADYNGVGSVSELSLLQAIDIYLRAAISRVEPGAEIDPLTGLPGNEADLLDDDRARSYLSQARDLSRGVIDATAGVEGRELLNHQAWMRLAASQEGLGSVEDAKASYARAAEAARSGGYAVLAALAEARAESAGDVTAADALPSRAQLLPLPGEEQVEMPAPMPEVTGTIEETDAEGDAATDPEAVSEPGEVESTDEPDAP